VKKLLGLLVSLLTISVLMLSSTPSMAIYRHRKDPPPRVAKRMEDNPKIAMVLSTSDQAPEKSTPAVTKKTAIGGPFKMSIWWPGAKDKVTQFKEWYMKVQVADKNGKPLPTASYTVEVMVITTAFSFKLDKQGTVVGDDGTSQPFWEGKVTLSDEDASKYSDNTEYTLVAVARDKEGKIIATGMRTVTHTH
jgi:hypothetical protein